MYTLEKKFAFEASHQLPLHNGKCRRLHGHSWHGAVILHSDSLVQSGPKTGMVMDFYDVGQVVNLLLEQYLDHHHLNNTTQLENPTSEELARWIYDKLKQSLPLMTAVRVEETCTSSCEYRPDGGKVG